MQNAPMQEAQLQSVGQQVLANILAPAVSNRALRSDPRFIARVRAVAAQYHLPVPMMGGEGGGAEGSGAGGEQSAAPVAASGAPGGVAPGGAAPPVAGGGTASQRPYGVAGGQVGPPQGPASVGGTLSMGNPASSAYQKLIAAAVADPNHLQDPQWYRLLTAAATKVGKTQQQVQSDFLAAQQQARSGGPGGANAAGTPPQGASPAANAAGTPAQAPSGTARAPGQEGQAPAASPTDSSAAYGPRNSGPLRLDVNAMLGRTLGFNDFKSLSGMTPQDRVEALRQGGYDLSEFDPKWLNENPQLDPAQQLALAKDVSTSIGKDISDGATPDQIKLTMASYRPYMTPAQNAEIDANISDQMDAALRIRQQGVVSTGLLRAGTLNLMNRKFAAQQQNTDWEHNYKYTVLNDKNAQWSTEQRTRQQNADTSSSRLNEEMARDQANGLVDANGKPIKAGAGSVKPSELINTARSLLNSINSGVNEYNTRLQNALQNPGKGGGVNPPMETDIQSEIDAYNKTVDVMNARGMNYFQHYTGPDQSAIRANTARATAGSAVNAQGQTATPPPKYTPTAWMPNGRGISKVNGKWVYSDDGTPVQH